MSINRFCLCLALASVTCLSPCHAITDSSKQGPKNVPGVRETTSDEETFKGNERQKISRESFRKIAEDEDEGHVSISSIETGYSLAVPMIPFEDMDEGFVDLSIFAAKLSKSVNGKEEDLLSAFPNALSWTDEPDKAILTKLDGICFVAFRATTWSFEDWWQNINPNFSRLILRYMLTCV